MSVDLHSTLDVHYDVRTSNVNYRPIPVEAVRGLAIMSNRSTTDRNAGVNCPIE